MSDETPYVGQNGDSPRRRRLGPTHTLRVERRQVRVGKPKEPVGIIRVEDALAPGDEIIVTRRSLRWLVAGFNFAETRS